MNDKYSVRLLDVIILTFCIYIAVKLAIYGFGGSVDGVDGMVYIKGVNAY
jgi:hypothetical protein